MNALFHKDAGKDSQDGKMGNDFSKGVDSAVSIITGIITGDMTGGLAGASAPWLAEQIKLHTGHLDKDGKWQTDDIAGNLIAHAILGAVVAELQGNSALSGGVGAVSGELASKAIINTLYGGKDASELTEEEKQTISALSQLASGLAVAAGGGNIGDASAAISSSKNAVENNGLAKPILKGLEKGYEFCMKNATCRNSLAQLGVNFGLTNDQIQEAMDAGKSRDPEKIKELSPEQVAWLDAQILAKKGLAPIMFGNETWGDKIYNESSNNELNNSEATAVGGAPILPPDDNNDDDKSNQTNKSPKTLQSGGNTINQNTTDKLNKYFGTNYHRRDWGRALEELKKDFNLRNDHHGKILSNGDYMSGTGRIIGNIADYLP